ncbi:nucleotidyltransferase domain-containing protein [Nitrincola sp. MINF-07-Sa-05]|uniref:nucleotidyltransferase domain-containing protein n=1 Tax=Nitrincola salilacus TaxID=3400273 RepID=UPI003917E5C0
MRLNPMRLSDHEKEAIVRHTHQVFGQNAQVYLFGSRTDDQKRGGDIDLFIETIDSPDNFSKKIKLLALLMESLGEQKIDIVMAQDPTRLIEQEARNTGVQL